MVYKKRKKYLYWAFPIVKVAAAIFWEGKSLLYYNPSYEKISY